MPVRNKQLKPEEMKAIASIVGGDAAAKDKAFADGLYIAGNRYVVARAEDRTIYARQVRQVSIPGHQCQAQRFRFKYGAVADVLRSLRFARAYRVDWVLPLPRPSRLLLLATTARLRLREMLALLLRDWRTTLSVRDIRCWRGEKYCMCDEMGLYKRESRRQNVMNM